MPLPNCCSSPSPGESDGQNVCTNCGAVFTESQIVSEIGFGENSAGAAVVQGSFIGVGETHARNTGPFRKGGGLESRERTTQDARRRIDQLAHAVCVPLSYVDTACRWFTLALTNNFTHGRKSEYVTACCLYIVCRQERSSHMLIDFSDVLHINVFVLGQTYLQLVRVLNIPVPTIDPSVYIHRFAKLLEFKGEQMKVATDAVRLVARFNRDWITQGRRPSGICGAALLLAARMNNFRRSVREIVYIVKVADLTIQKRLEEFRQTASSNLTVEDFRNVWLEQAHDPPSFGPKKRKRRIRDVDENGEPIGKTRARTATPAPAGRASTTPALTAAAKRRVDKDGFAIPALPTPPSTQPVTAGSSSTPAATQEDTPTGEDDEMPIDPALLGGLINPEDLNPTPLEEPNTEDEVDDDIHPADKIANDAILNEITSFMNSDTARSAVEEIQKERREDEIQRARSVSVMSSAPGERARSVSVAPAGSGDENNNGERATTPAPSIRAGSPTGSITALNIDPEDEDLSIFDDDWEVAGALLNEAERDVKERIWVANNRDYLKQQEAKKLKEARDLRNGLSKTRKRRKKDTGDGTKKIAASPAESAKELLKGKAFSKKINYQALDYLFAKDDDQSSGGAPSNSSRAPSVDV